MLTSTTQSINRRNDRRTELLSWGSFKDPPSIDTNAGCPLPSKSKPTLRQLAATPATRSALVVPPDSDGLLHPAPRKSIAPCSRPWGSPRFRTVRRPLFPNGADPSKLFPSEPPRDVADTQSLSLLDSHPPVLPQACMHPNLREVSSQEVRCTLKMLPSPTARCSHGLRPDLHVASTCRAPDLQPCRNRASSPV
jgi:hypothetical protein